MAKRFFLTMVIALVFGATAAAADPALNGRWFVDDWDEVLIFDNGNWELWAGEYPRLRGTYTAGNGAIVLTATHTHASELDALGLELQAEWYTQSQIVSLSVAETKTLFTAGLLDELRMFFSENPLDELRAEMDELAADAELQELTANVVEVFGQELSDANQAIASIITAELVDTGDSPELIEIIVEIANIVILGVFYVLIDELEDLFWTNTGAYSVSGDTLLLAIDLFGGVDEGTGVEPIRFTRR